MTSIKHVFFRLLSSFQAKLVVSFLCCSVIPFVIVGSIGYYTSFRIAEDKIMESTSLSNKQLVQYLNDRFSQIERICDSAQNYLYILTNKPEEPMTEYMDYFSYTRNNLAALNDNFQLFQICAFLPEDSFISNEGLMFYSLKELKKFKIEEQELTNIGLSSKWLFRDNLDFPSILTKGETGIDTILCCQSTSLRNQLHFAFFAGIRADTISEQLHNSFLNTPVTSYLLTPDGAIAAHTDENVTGRLLPQDELRFLLAHSDAGAVTRNSCRILINSLDNGFFLVTEIPVSYITDNIKSVIQVTLTTLLLMIPAVIIVIVMISNTLTKRLKKLSQVVSSTHIDGQTVTAQQLDSHFHPDSEYGDEIDHLAGTYQTMVRTIDRNLGEILNLTVTEERLKYQLLQSQINPHFLYNILGSIKTCQTIGRLETASQMLTGLSQFYRLMLKTNHDLIPLRDEIRISALYLELEQLCRGGEVTWELDLEDGIDNFMICKFTLQPFLENCILHGIVHPVKSVHIKLAAVYGDDTIIITIEDNGAGIEPSRLDDLQDCLSRHEVQYSRHFGISNVNARIASPLFGAGRIQIESAVAKGTKITIEFRQMLDDSEI